MILLQLGQKLPQVTNENAFSTKSGVHLVMSCMQCKKADTDEFHPLNYQQLKNAQDKGKTIQKNLKRQTLYMLTRTSMGEEI
jgi:hypothetical protein